MKKLNIFFIFAFIVLIAVPLAMAASAVQIQPDPANDLDTLNCAVLAGGSGYTYTWYKNGQQTSISGAYVQPGYTAAGQTWKCVVKKYYGAQIGWITIGQDSIVIQSSANQLPVVQIVAPDNGDTFIEGTSIFFNGTATDPEDGAIFNPASYQWVSDIDGNLGTGMSLNLNTLSAGTHIITLLVSDSQGAVGNDSITIVVNPAGANQPPLVQIISPNDGDSFNQSSMILFTGSAVDPEEGALTGNNLVWTSDIDGNFGNGTSVNINSLSNGTHVITLIATDSLGASNNDTITITINPLPPVNQAPVVNITHPANNSGFPQGTSILFNGTATDFEDGPITSAAQLNWSSSIDGIFGSGNTANFAGLSAGTHVITLTAVDSLGATGSDSIIIIITGVNNPPVVNITLPANNSNFSCGQLVNFAGTASDPDNDSLTLIWFSSIDGLLGYGNTTQDILTCNATHQIDFVGDDSQVNATDTIWINIGANLTTNNFPNATIISPLNASQYVECQQMLFNATAADVEGIRSTEWYYNSINLSNSLTFTLPASYFGVGNHTVSFRVVDTDGNINETYVSFEVVGHQSPSVTITNPANNTQWLQGTMLNFSATATNNDPVCPTNFTWIWRDNSVQIWNTSQSFSNDNLSIGNHTITAYATDSYNASASDEITIEIVVIPNEIPFVQITSPVDNASFVNECQQIFFNSTAYDTDGNITEYQWIWNSNPISNSSNFTLPASYFSNGNHSVRLIVRDNRNGQNSTSVNFTVVPHVAPTITITSPSNNSNFSEGTLVNFSAVAAANDVCAVNFSFSWMDGANPLSSYDNFSRDNLSIGTHTIIARVDDSYGLWDTDSIILNILEIPNMLPNITDITCYNATGGTVLNEFEPIMCIANANDTDGNITSWVWNVQGQYGPIFTPYNMSVPYPYLANGAYNVSLTVEDNDLNQTTMVVPIVVQNNAPVVNLTAFPLNGVEPLAVNFTCSVQQGTGNSPYTYNFNSGDVITDVYTGNETSVVFTVNSYDNGTYTAICSVTDSDGDIGNSSVTITINDTVPVGNFNWTPQMPYECENVFFTSNVSAYDGILSYFWDFLDGSNSSQQNPVHNFTQNGSYNVALTVLDMDFSPSVFTGTVNVNDTNPVVEAGPDRNVTEGNNLTFVGTGIQRCDPITQYEWYFADDGSTHYGNVVSHNFTRNGTFLVTFTVYDSDSSSTDNLTVTVFDTTPNAQGFAIPNPVVEGNQIQFNGSLSTGYDQPLSYSWNVNGTILPGEVVNYTFPSYLTNSPIIVNVILTVTDSDGSTDNDTITVVVVDSVPNASAALLTPDPIYEGDVVSFDAGSSTGYDLPLNYTWYFGDGTINTTQLPAITHVYQQNDTYLVRLVVTDADGSWDDDFLTVDVLDTTPIVNFNWVPAIPFEGEQVNFTDLSTIPAFDNITAWFWDFGDGSNSSQQNASHTYVYEGSYNVTLYVRDFDDSAWSNLTQQITVQNLLPVVTLTPAVVSGNESLYVTFNCSASGNYPFTFRFDAQGDGSNEITTVSQTGILFSWNYTQNGTYNPMCNVTDNDGDSVPATAVVNVGDLGPTASVTGNTMLYEGQTGTYNASGSTSSPDTIVSYEWDFNYPSSFALGGAIQNYTFTDNGTFNVAVRVTDSDGTQDTAVLVVNVYNLPPSVNFLQNSYVTNESLPVTFYANGTDPSIVDQLSLQYEWDFDYRSGMFTVDATTSVPIITMSWPDDLNVTVAVRAVDKDGGISNLSFADLLVNNVPPVAIVAGPYICSNQSIASVPNATLFAIINDPGNDTFTHMWNITGMTPVQINTPDRNSSVVFVCTGKPTGIYDVTFQVWDDDWGYSGIYSTYINITDTLANLPPTIVLPAENQTINAQANASSSFMIFAFDPNGDNMIFSVNDTAITLGAQNQSLGFTTVPMNYNFSSLGIYNFNLTVCDDSGFANNCTSRLFSINVTNQTVSSQAPVADFTINPNPADEGTLVSFDGAASYDPDGIIMFYQWNFGDNSTVITNTSSSNHTYMDNGVYVVTLTVFDNSGLSNSTSRNVTIVNVAPVITISSPISMVEDTPITITLTAVDVDTITWSAISSANINVVVNGNNATLTPAANWSGSEIINFTATDKDGASSSALITVNVAPVNDAPSVIAPASALSATEDSLFTYQINATDVDNASLVYGVINAPAGMTVNPATGIISWTPTNANVGSNVFNVTASDGQYTASAQVTVNVANVPAAITTTSPPSSWLVNTTYVYDFNSDDDGQGIITWSLQIDGVTSAAINSATGLVNWLPDQIKIYSMNVTVNDGYSDTSFLWTVNVTGGNVSIPVVITNVNAISITNESATITWDTNVNANSTVNYGITTALGSQVNDNTPVMSHSMPLASLQSNTTYYFNVTSCDASGCAVSGPYSFTTLANSGMNITPSNYTIVNSTINSIYYPLNHSYEVPRIADNLTRVINSVMAFASPYTMSNSWIENASPVTISGGNVDNCTILNTGWSSTAGCINVFADPSNITLDNPTGTRFIDSFVYYYNVTYSWVNSSYLMYVVINNSVIQNSTIINSEILNSDINDSFINDSDINDSVIIDSNITDSDINDSEINDSNINDSDIDNCTIINSTLNSAFCQDDIIINSDVNDTAICGGTVNGFDLNGTCIYFPVITQFNVPSSAYVGDGPSFSVAISNRNSSNNESAEPYIYTWTFGDNTGVVDGPKNGTSDSTSHIYSADGTYTVSVTVENKYMLSASSSSSISLTVYNSGGGSGGHSGSSGGSAGNTGILSYTGKEYFLNLSDGKPKSAFVYLEDVISFEFNGEKYTVEFGQINDQSVDMLIYPPRIPVTLLKQGTTIEDLDDDLVDDLSMKVNDLVREVDGAGFVRWKINMTLRLVNLPNKKAPVEIVKDTLSDVKEGVLDVIGTITPSEKASPYIGSAITVGIIAIGLGGYFTFRKKKPKL